MAISSKDIYQIAWGLKDLSYRLKDKFPEESAIYAELEYKMNGILRELCSQERCGPQRYAQLAVELNYYDADTAMPVEIKRHPKGNK